LAPDSKTRTTMTGVKIVIDEQLVETNIKLNFDYKVFTDTKELFNSFFKTI